MRTCTHRHTHNPQEKPLLMVALRRLKQEECKFKASLSSLGKRDGKKKKHGKENENGEEGRIQKMREGKGEEQRRKNRKEEQIVNELEI